MLAAADSLKSTTGGPHAKFLNVKKHFNEAEKKLICRTGSYPHEFTDTPEKLTFNGLPAKNHVLLKR